MTSATIVNVHDAKTHLSRLLELVETGESVTIARAGKPIADLVPHTRADIVFGGFDGQIVVEVGYDVDAADDEVIAMFEENAEAPL